MVKGIITLVFVLSIDGGEGFRTEVSMTKEYETKAECIADLGKGIETVSEFRVPNADIKRVISVSSKCDETKEDS